MNYDEGKVARITSRAVRFVPANNVCAVQTRLICFESVFCTILY